MCSDYFLDGSATGDVVADVFDSIVAEAGSGPDLSVLTAVNLRLCLSAIFDGAAGVEDPGEIPAPVYGES